MLTLYTLHVVQLKDILEHKWQLTFSREWEIEKIRLLPVDDFLILCHKWQYIQNAGASKYEMDLHAVSTFLSVIFGDNLCHLCQATSRMWYPSLSLFMQYFYNMLCVDTPTMLCVVQQFCSVIPQMAVLLTSRYSRDYHLSLDLGLNCPLLCENSLGMF